jgi:arylsulfatase A-like enzyme
VVLAAGFTVRSFTGRVLYSPIPMPPDLLLILCDTARADAFRPWGARQETPVMERLAERGMVYSRATAQAPWTLPSTASILSGRLPTEHGITGDCFRWEDGKPTSPAEAVRSFDGPWLPDMLRDRGYRTWAASCNTWISAWGGFDRGFERFLDLRDRTRLPKGRAGSVLRRARRMWGKVDRGGRQTVDAFRQRLAESRSEPLFAMVNLMEVHAPYDPPRPFYPFAFWKRANTRRLSGGTTKARRFLSYNTRVARPPADYVRTVRQLYYHAARYEDWLLGRFVKAILASGRPTVVAVVADHGENLGEHGLFNHNSSLGETLLHVPLVVWGHRVDVGRARVEEPVSLLGLGDWLRGLADGNGSPISANGPVVAEYESTIKHNGIPADIQGMLESGDPSRVPGLVFHPGLAARKGPLKYVATDEGGEALYDLDADPGEDRNLLADQPGAAVEFVPLRQAWEKRRVDRPVYVAGDIAEGEIADHLRTLGYIE